MHYSELMKILLMTDLDGCLLNKQDYDYAPARPVLDRLARAEVTVVLSSSKTEAEMTPLADELGLAEMPLSCENGGVVIWRSDGEPSREVLGAERSRIRVVLDSLRSQFQFRSFTDLEVDGVMETTDLPRDKAERACDRRCTEPLLYDGPGEAIADFKAAVEAHDLTMTRGGRFWHIAGHTTKGKAMLRIVERFERTLGKCATIAIGDSPIDQSMLDIATYPIGIPQPNGDILVTVNANGIIAETPGSAGWAWAVSQVLDGLGVAK